MRASEVPLTRCTEKAKDSPAIALAGMKLPVVVNYNIARAI
jgi:hypothetical protein